MQVILPNEQVQQIQLLIAELIKKEIQINIENQVLIAPT